MNTETRMSRCHEYEGDWTPEVGTKAYREGRIEAWEFFECRPGATEPGKFPVQRKTYVKAADIRLSTPRKSRMHVLQIISHRQKTEKRVGKVHLKGASCHIARVTGRVKVDGRIVVDAKEFTDVLDANYHLCCGKCLEQFDGKKLG